MQTKKYETGAGHLILTRADLHFHVLLPFARVSEQYVYNLALCLIESPKTPSALSF
jgi:hypothetical protein